MVSAIWHDEEGLTNVEYAILLALLFVAWVVSWSVFGGKVRSSLWHTNAVFAAVLGEPSA